MVPRNSSSIYSSSSVWGEGLEEVEALQREKNRRGSLVGTTDSIVDQQHRMTFCASKHARRSYYKPAILMGSGFLVDMLLRGCFLRRGVVIFWWVRRRDVGCINSSLHERHTSFDLSYDTITGVHS